jgi:Arc/MetJ-type ribon-helix-helix transcriptional regulator
MKSIQIELPEKLAHELDMLVQQGWFCSEEEAIRFALLEFLRRHRLELLEQFQRDDIAWALRHKDVAGSDGSCPIQVPCSICTKPSCSRSWSTPGRSIFPGPSVSKWRRMSSSGELVDRIGSHSPL